MAFDHVLDYRMTDFTATGKRYDLILDARPTRSPLRHLRALERAGDLFDAGSPRPVIDGPYDLADVPRALRRFGDADHVGKVVVEVA